MKYPQLVSMPSAVSDWLDEQLEARGIDAVVYTRYVLSLLHQDDTLDLVNTEQDIQIPKEARQSSHGRKRFRRSTDWWCHIGTDVEQLRRSAAVECLMSASDQTCGIESLVDELCEKLKHFESTSTDKNDDKASNQNETSIVSSPNDLAKRYYAAFPPLTSNSTITNKITLIPPQLNNNKRKYGNSNKKISIQRTFNREIEMKSRSGGKQRFSYFNRSSKKDFGFARSMEKSERSGAFTDWDFYSNQNRTGGGDEGYSTSDTTGGDEASELEQMNKNMSVDDNNLADLVAKFDQRIEALWHTDETCMEQNNENEYHDLPVDIQELLASPTKETNAIEILNVVNKRANDKFIQCGTNITSSIWSEFENEKSLYDSITCSNLYNEALETYPEKILGDQFNCLSMSATDSSILENETNKLYESFADANKNSDDGWEVILPIGSFKKKWSDGGNYNYVDLSFTKRNVLNDINKSLLRLNHEEASFFKEVIPKQVLGLNAFTVCAQNDSTNNSADENLKEEEDLLTSTRTHFRPIRNETNRDTSANSSGGVINYVDGTTFTIRSSLDHVNYKRSESGTLYLESGFDTPKKYMEYRMKENDDEECCSIEREFVLKFCVKQNEKYCQTELNGETKSYSPLEVPAKKRVLCDPDEFFFPGDEELLLSDVMDSSCECSCQRARAKLATNLEPLFNASAVSCEVHGTRPDSMLSLELGWKKCDKCNVNWSSGWQQQQENKDNNGVESWKRIWNSNEELCRTCLGVPAGPGTSAGRSTEYFKLRDELSEDGEQLLSDLSCLQRVYMEQLPSSEISCNLSESVAVAAAFVTTITASKERKRRHSSSQRPSETLAVTTLARNSWTNASCLKGQQRSFTPPPLLRPITL